MKCVRDNYLFYLQDWLIEVESGKEPGVAE